jgi:hypothetical protein
VPQITRRTLSDQLLPYGPSPLQFVLKRVPIDEGIEAGGRLSLSGGQHRQNGAALAFIAQAPSSAEHAFAVLPQDF